MSGYYIGYPALDVRYGQLAAANSWATQQNCGSAWLTTAGITTLSASSGAIDCASGVTRLFGIGPNTSTPGTFQFSVYSSNASVAKVALSISNAGLLRANQYGAGTLSTDASGNITASSDERLKHVVAPFTRGLSDLLKMDGPVIYNLLSDFEGHEYSEIVIEADKVVESRTIKESGYSYDYAGFTAQAVAKGIPEAVGEGEDGMFSLDQRPLVAALVNAVIELSKRIEALEAR